MKAVGIFSIMTAVSSLWVTEVDGWLAPMRVTTPSASTRSAPPLHFHPKKQQCTVRQLSTTERMPETPRLTSEDEAILFGNEEGGGEGEDSMVASVAVAPSSHSAPFVTDDGAVGTLLSSSQDDDDDTFSNSNSNHPLVQQLHRMREQLTSCPQLWLELERYCPDQRALLDEHLCDTKVDWTFAQMSQKVQQSATVFANLGVTPGVNVAILGENSAHWLIADHGIQLAGGASAVRGADAPLEELRYIYQHSDSAGIVVLQGPKLLEKLMHDQPSGALGLSNAKYGPVHTVILLHREKKTPAEIQQLGALAGVTVALLADLLDRAEPMPARRRPTLTRTDVSTIVYTSGTTGRPKGVMLTHGNLIHQMGHRVSPTRPYHETEPLPGDTTVVLLPVWHITERMFELWMAARGASIVYSSIRTFRNDLAKHRPQFLVLVPRVLEKVAAGVQEKFASSSTAVRALVQCFTATGHVFYRHQKIARGWVVGDQPPTMAQKVRSKAMVLAMAPLMAVGNKLVWSKVQAGFGGRCKLIISGGSALAGSLETFYETAGLKIVVGFGLTECSPLLTFRRGDANLVAAGCAGQPCADTELCIVDPDSKATTTARRPSLPIGQVGVVIAKGPQIMKGYYKNEEATAQAIDPFGFFDTGDLGRINPATGDLILTGRAKDTIVLSNGENIEPTPIEDAILGESSSLIEQVMLTGQDGRRLVAIVVLNPRELGAAGFLSPSEAATLQAANEKANDPKCTPEACHESCAVLNAAAAKLRANGPLRQELIGRVGRATANFRKWEQVGDIYLTLEPFAMANGLLTQSYKVKRDAVLNRYQEFLPN